MARRRRPRTVTITELLASRYPDLADPAGAVASGRVLVDGRPVLNPEARVTEAASLTVDRAVTLRGSPKLEAALAAFGVDVTGRVALDAGAAAGGFTSVLVEHGAARVYAVDVGHGQLRGSLRQDPRVVNLERTNLGDLTADLVPDRIGLLTLDLSYLSIARALPQLDRIGWATPADLVALVKPMFELGRDRPPVEPGELQEAVERAGRGAEAVGWHVVADMDSPVRGARGAVEFFVHARR